MNLHIGCGPIKLAGYVNIDIEPSHSPDICGDVLQMDFKGVDVIYSCHMFEHLSYPNDAVKFLALCYKWLKPEGVLRLGVPDLKLAVQYYWLLPSEMYSLYGKEFKGFYYMDTPAERLNFFVKSWQHQMCYDFELLRLLLFDAWFRNIEKKLSNESAIPNFNHDRFISESLYVEAIK